MISAKSENRGAICETKVTEKSRTFAAEKKQQQSNKS